MMLAKEEIAKMNRFRVYKTGIQWVVEDTQQHKANFISRVKYIDEALDKFRDEEETCVPYEDKVKYENDGVLKRAFEDVFGDDGEFKLVKLEDESGDYFAAFQMERNDNVFATFTWAPRSQTIFDYTIRNYVRKFVDFYDKVGNSR